MTCPDGIFQLIRPLAEGARARRRQGKWAALLGGLPSIWKWTARVKDGSGRTICDLPSPTDQPSLTTNPPRPYQPTSPRSLSRLPGRWFSPPRIGSSAVLHSSQAPVTSTTQTARSAPRAHSSTNRHPPGLALGPVERFLGVPPPPFCDTEDGALSSAVLDTSGELSHTKGQLRHLVDRSPHTYARNPNGQETTDEEA